MYICLEHIYNLYIYTYIIYMYVYKCITETKKIENEGIILSILSSSQLLPIYL